MSAPILLLQNITYTLGGRPLLDGAELGVLPGERICLVGRNGSGKSTLLKIAAGDITADDGTRFVQPGVKVHYLAQEPDLSAYPSTFHYVADGLDETEHYRARAMLAELGMTGDEGCERLSGGEVRRCALARALAAEPDLLLLDEPTNHLDLPTITWLEKELAASRCAMIVISHDRRLLETLSRSVVWLEQGKTRRLDQGFSRYETWRDEVLEQEERDAHKLDRQIAREEDWMRYGVTARRKRNVRRVAELATLRNNRREIASRGTGTLRMAATEAEGAGKITIGAENLGWTYGDRQIVKNLDLKVLRGDRLGLVGANGAGKTTLIRLLTGRMAPQEGSVYIGPSVAMVTLDQQRESLDPAKTLSDTLTGGSGDMVQVGTEKRHVIGYMKDFMFRPEQARTPVGKLSGGERGRLALACALAKPSSLMVLDEPTNDLDLETLDLLQDMLADYAGTVLLVSHDRDFLDRVAGSVLVSEGNGQWIEYAGGYSDMLVQRRGEAPAERSVDEKSQEVSIAKNTVKSDKKQTKLSYNDKRTLDLLPGKMAKLEKEIVVYREALADPGLYSRDPAKFTKISDALQVAENALTEAEEQWLNLEAKKEELQSQ
ncbi:ABC transporter [Gluconobacter thailandicus F149-1 = NBRC 100600]|uniref:ABC transporter ATP-binding protein n=1 Tax=Gluconobacter thailandicus NBRC 3257 TaxID=1381097 RepID=A0ABQ0J0L3_GLUTH|nr:ATP-binding cassette domain-containing protein [Gluconobacter thailandicus]KXV54876.1 elongation factor 3 [Gluconobacter thailandicus]GAC86808.1 ABC transporter ATP-binding protein [Gluconobacter thailandicus NBRC 3255]GAD27995.1 ABC transporter ATP-binding protein [Gluconobacter thailandicus NBRC 3257]GAN94710.1 ABC transporter [Gluconobacter thailandicus F149-1 = NBRC 100600]GEL86733.1 ATP-binding protein [Gluconobacter thailandicus F149-1 = NBRC 100600]